MWVTRDRKLARMQAPLRVTRFFRIIFCDIFMQRSNLEYNELLNANSPYKRTFAADRKKKALLFLVYLLFPLIICSTATVSLDWCQVFWWCNFTTFMGLALSQPAFLISGWCHSKYKQFPRCGVVLRTRGFGLKNYEPKSPRMTAQSWINPRQQPKLNNYQSQHPPQIASF